MNKQRFLILIAILLSACALNPAAQEQAAGDALREYFESLNTGDYARAAELYGGDYTALADMNPEVDPDDHAALLKQACTVNGFVCLRLASLKMGAHPSPGKYAFEVEFADENGDTYARMPCCTTPLPGEVMRSEFSYTVVKNEDGQFRVMELPLMEP